MTADMLMTGGCEWERLQRGRHPEGCAQARGQPRDRGHAQGPQVSLIQEAFALYLYRFSFYTSPNFRLSDQFANFALCILPASLVAFWPKANRNSR